MEKLSQIYGASVAPASNISGGNLNNKKQAIQVVSGQQILRKQSAGNKRSEDGAALG